MATLPFSNGLSPASGRPATPTTSFKPDRDAGQGAGIAALPPVVRGARGGQRGVLVDVEPTAVGGIATGNPLEARARQLERAELPAGQSGRGLDDAQIGGVTADGGSLRSCRGHRHAPGLAKSGRAPRVTERGPSSADDHGVLDADAPLAGHVHARLDRDHEAGLQQGAVALDHGRGLVHVGTQPVARAGTRPLAVAGIVDHRRGGLRDLLDSRPRDRRCDACGLRRADDLVGLAVLGRRLAEERLLGDVREVAVEADGDVDEHGLAGPEHVGRGVVVGLGRVRTALHEHVVDGLGAALPEEALEQPLHLELGHAGADAVVEEVDRCRDQLAAARDALLLVGRLDETQIAHERARQRGLGAEMPPQVREELERQLVVDDRLRRGRQVPEPLERLLDRRRGADPVGPLHDVAEPGRLDELGRLEVGHHHDRRVTRDDERRQAIGRERPEPSA